MQRHQLPSLLRGHLPPRAAMLVSCLLIVFLVAACGDGAGESTTTSEPSGSTTASEPSVTSSTAGSQTSTTLASTDELRIAFLAATTDNPPQTASFEAMKEYASAHNATVTALDGKLDATEQFNQLQQIAVTDSYDGVVVTPLDGESMIPAVEQALAADIGVAVMSTPLGSDFSTPDAPIEGVAISVLRPPAAIGEQIGDLTVEACADIDSCKVAFLHAVTVAPFDQAIFGSFQDKLGSNVELVFEADTGASASGGREAVQTLLQSNPDVDVIVGWAQSLIGGQPPLDSLGRLGTVKLVGVNGSNQAMDQMVSGGFGWVGLSAVFPDLEGTAAIEGLIAYLRNGKTQGGVDVTETVPGEGLITPTNAEEFVGSFPN